MAVLTNCPFKSGASCDKALCYLWDEAHSCCSFTTIKDMLHAINLLLGGV